MIEGIARWLIEYALQATIRDVSSSLIPLKLK
jgi:hypothetical protein